MNHILVEDAIAIPNILDDLLVLDSFEQHLHLFVVA